VLQSGTGGSLASSVDEQARNEWAAVKATDTDPTSRCRRARIIELDRLARLAEEGVAIRTRKPQHRQSMLGLWCEVWPTPIHIGQRPSARALLGCRS